jgi:hypothetical protein
VLNKGEALDNIIVPSAAFEVDYEAKKPEKDPDADNLRSFVRSCPPG